VPQKYLYDSDEITQLKLRKNLFEKFDFDNSGALDSKELTALYKRNKINVTESDIQEMYGQ